MTTPPNRPDHKPRIMQLITDLELGGAPMMVQNLSLGLHQRGYEVAVTCLAKAGPVADTLRHHGIIAAGFDAWSAIDISVLWRLAQFIRKYRPDILHCHLMHANVVGRLVGRLCYVPRIIATIHTAERKKHWHLWLESLTQRLSNRIICVSPSVQRHMSTYIAQNRLKTICNGIDVDKYHDAQPYNPWELELNPDLPILIFTGRLDPVKNIGKIIQAIKLLSESGHQVQLLIVGDGPMKSELLASTRLLQLTRHIHFLGARRDIPRLLKSADIFIMASRWEGMSISALEAMAAETPIIASNVPGLNDMIRDQQNGLLFDPASPQQIATKIKTLLDNKPQARQLAQNASQTVRQQYSLTAMIDHYCTLYHQLSPHPPQPSSP